MFVALRPAGLIAVALLSLTACRGRPEGSDTKAAVARSAPKPHRQRVPAEPVGADTLTPMALQWGTDVSCNGLGPDSTEAQRAAGWRVAGDTVTAPAASGVWLSRCHMADTDVHVQLFLPGVQGAGTAGIAFRAADSLTFYMAQIHPGTGQVSIAISQHGVIRQIGSTAMPGTSTGPWYDMRVVAIDNALELWLGGRPVLAVGDSLLHHGATGVWAGDRSGARFSGWRAIGKRSSYGA